ncbi:MAG: hypothetical protein H6Q25_337 [Bacteroidetes bacterium]|nr:hypothetical protein [Bacteroidota bacterium]
MNQALVLNYHLIDNHQYPFDSFGGIYAVSIEQFKAQLALLQKFKIPVVSLSDILNSKIQDPFCVALTFDDGNPSDFETVFPILQEFGYTATFFLSIQNIGQQGVTWEKYLEMIRRGMHVGSHGVTHCDLTVLSNEKVRFELMESKKRIEENLGIEIMFFSFPFGRTNSVINKIANELGYSNVLTTRFAFINPSENHIEWGRWSIKRGTTLKQFSSIIQRKPLSILKLQWLSGIKKMVIDRVGLKWINRINTFLKRIKKI